jgi:hypothetical protein
VQTWINTPPGGHGSGELRQFGFSGYAWGGSVIVLLLEGLGGLGGLGDW